MHVVWKGTIAFGLVSIPVQLYAATEEHSFSFRQVHAADGGRIRYRRVCENDGEEVSFADIARAVPLPDGENLVLSDEDLARLPLPSSRAIEVLSFTDAENIDPIRLSRSYFCEPSGAALRPYALLREALLRTGRVAMAKVALRQRESLAVLRVRENVIVLQLLLWPDEVRDPRFPFLDDDVTLSARELDLAETLIDTLTGATDPAQLVDEYRTALGELIESKLAGRLVTAPSAAPAHPAMDLMEALRRTVEQAQRHRSGRS
jgi:DNA end-binding protein Ku